jgi:hypothetical protein
MVQQLQVVTGNSSSTVQQQQRQQVEAAAAAGAQMLSTRARLVSRAQLSPAGRAAKLLSAFVLGGVFHVSFPPKPLR